MKVSILHIRRAFTIQEGGALSASILYERPDGSEMEATVCIDLPVNASNELAQKETHKAMHVCLDAVLEDLQGS